MAQTQSQTQPKPLKTLRLARQLFVKGNGKIAVFLKRADGKDMVAFLDPARIKGVVITTVPYTPQKPGDKEMCTVINGKYIYEASKKQAEWIKEIFPSVTVIPDRVPRYYIIYETSHDYYKPAEVEKPEGEVFKKGGLEILSDWSDRIRPCGDRTWRVYLYEEERWDKYCFDFKTAVSILDTNIHPVYGVMD